MMQREQQHVGGTMHVEVVHNRIHALNLCRYPRFDVAEKVDPVHGYSPAIQSGVPLCALR